MVMGGKNLATDFVFKKYYLLNNWVAINFKSDGYKLFKSDGYKLIIN
jgi:hypothetical protein